MKILQISEPENLQLLEEPITDFIEREYALVKICFVSLCGSDYKLYEGKYSAPNSYPIIFGHEWSGKILKINSKTSLFQEGDHVTGDCSKWCGSCVSCHDDKNVCLNIEKYGITINGYAKQLAMVPLKYIYKAPSSIPLQVLALTEPFAVALNAIKKIDFKKKSEKSYLILGVGNIGIAIYMLLKYMFGIDDCAVCDVNTYKIEQLMEIMYGDEIKIFQPQNNNENKGNYKSMYTGSEFDTIFEVTGNSKVLKKTLKWIKPMGHIITLGFYSDTEINFNPLVVKNISIQGSIGGTGSFTDVIKFMQSYSDRIQKIISYTYPLIDCNKAFDYAKAKKKFIKQQINMQ